VRSSQIPYNRNPVNRSNLIFNPTKKLLCQNNRTKIKNK
jgi:hypothetical protein